MDIIFRRDGDDEVTDLRVVQIHVGEGPQHMLREQGISALKTLDYLDYAPWPVGRAIISGHCAEAEGRVQCSRTMNQHGW